MWIKEEIERIGSQIKAFQADGLKVITSSSFQSHSIPLLHLIAQVDASIPVYFLNTGFHFPETIQYKNDVSKLLGLQTIDLYSATDKLFQRDNKGRFLYASEPNYCCHINKI